MNKKHVAFKNRMIILGMGSIGQGVLPLLLRHIDMLPEQITIITADQRGKDEAGRYGIEFIEKMLTLENYVSVLEPRLLPGTFLLNLSVDVDTCCLIKLCQQKGALYLDTCINCWHGGALDAKHTASERSLYYKREEALAMRPAYVKGPTTVLDHGANPGLVDHMVKQALLNMAHDTGLEIEKPTSRQEWAQLSKQLGIKVIHISERDTQYSAKHKERDEFVNTWSIDGLFSEGVQPSELGWGTHEKQLPSDGRRHGFGCDAAIYLDRPGLSTLVRSWTPLEGSFYGFLITHGEAIAISDYLTLFDENDKPVYRPTCHYAYHPCDATVMSLNETISKNCKLQSRQRLIRDDIVDGMDELGVLLMGNAKGVYWYGSRLTIHQARALAEYNNATSLQVTASVMAGMVWAMENPNQGIVEPEDMSFERILEIVRPYLGDVVGVWGDWDPLKGRLNLFNEDVDLSDPWQFQNIRVH